MYDKSNVKDLFQIVFPLDNINSRIAQREPLDMKNILSATESAHFATLDMKFDKLVRKYDTFIPPTACSSCEVSSNQSTVALREVTELKKVQVGKDQEKAQSEKDSHSKNRGGKKPN